MVAGGKELFTIDSPSLTDSEIDWLNVLQLWLKDWVTVLLEPEGLLDKNEYWPDGITPVDVNENTPLLLAVTDWEEPPGRVMVTEEEAVVFPEIVTIPLLPSEKIMLLGSAGELRVEWLNSSDEYITKGMSDRTEKLKYLSRLIPMLVREIRSEKNNKKVALSVGVLIKIMCLAVGSVELNSLKIINLIFNTLLSN